MDQVQRVPDRSEVAELRARVATLTATVAAAHGQIRVLQATVSNQARTLMEVTGDVPPWAPSLAILYWKWSEARRGEKCWRLIWSAIRPLIDDLGALPAPLLTALAWDEHRARRRQTLTKYGKPPCEATLNTGLIYAKSMLTWAVEHGMIKRNNLQSARPVQTLSRRETRITPEDLDRLLIAAEDVVDRRKPAGDDDGRRELLLRAFLLAIFDSMLRFNEARTLRRDRIGPDGLVELLASETKSKRRRFVKLTARTLEAISALGRTDGYIFTMGGELVSESALREWFTRARKISGVRAIPRDGEVQPRDGRAGGATWADANGARPTAVQATLGHVSLETTAIYLRSDPSDSAYHVAAIMEESTRIGPRRAVSRKKVQRD